MSEWVTGKVLKIQHWTKKLFSLVVTAPVSSFTAGQFTKVRMEANGSIIQRAYSYVNAPENNNLEFYMVMVPNGKMTPYLVKKRPGEEILISKNSSGFFILKEIPSSKILWMLATGTAIGPYLSILQSGNDLEKFKHLVLVYAVRYQEDLSYLSLINTLKKRYSNKLKTITVLSREVNTASNSLKGRITTLIKNGMLEEEAGLNLNKNTSHVMLCGNPNMVKETRDLLMTTRNMNKHLRRSSGHITVEQYW